MRSEQWFSGFTPTGEAWARSRPIAVPALTVWADGYRVEVTRWPECPSDRESCGAIAERPCKRSPGTAERVCLLPPGHESPHLPCELELAEKGVRFTVVMARAPEAPEPGDGYDLRDCSIEVVA